MSDSFDTWVRGVMSGEARGVTPAVLRTTLGAIEPAYAGVAALRNRLFDRGTKRVHRLPRPVISVGNLTTGGTGKTPFVQWLVRELSTLGHTPAVLMRGYARADAASESDEQRVLRESLPDVPIIADPDRVSAALRALEEQPAISIFLLDDGFQHRRLARDLDIVLVDATNPFGYEHVLPRGMLRERPAGLRRAGLIAITRVERVPGERVDTIEFGARSLASPGVPIVRVPYRMDDVRVGDAPPAPIATLAGRRAYAISAIGNPQAFEDGLIAAGIDLVGRRRFADHHAYAQSEVNACLIDAKRLGVALLLTTEKDWAKLRDRRLTDVIVGRISVRADPPDRLRQLIVGRLAPRSV